MSGNQNTNGFDIPGLFKDEKGTVVWICLTNAGNPVKEDENWFSTKKAHSIV